MLACNKPERIHCKAGSVSVRLAFETRGKCQDFVVRHKDDGIPNAINSPFCCASTTVTVRQSRSIEDRAIGKQFMPLWKEWADQLKVIFLMQMTKVYSSSPRSIPAHKSSASKIAETELEIQYSNLLHLVADKRLCLLHLICLSLVFLLMCCNGFSLKSTGHMCDGRSLASPLFRRLAGRGAFFCGSLFRWVLHIVFHLTRGSRRFFLLFPVSMDSTLGGLFDSRFYLACVIILFQGRFS